MHSHLTPIFLTILAIAVLAGIEQVWAEPYNYFQYNSTAGTGQAIVQTLEPAGPTAGDYGLTVINIYRAGTLVRAQFVWQPKTSYQYLHVSLLDANGGGVYPCIFYKTFSAGSYVVELPLDGCGYTVKEIIFHVTETSSPESGPVIAAYDVDALPSIGAKIDVTAPAKVTGEAGKPITFKLTVRNMGQLQADIRLESQPGDASFEPNNFPLPPGGSATVTVTIPPKTAGEYSYSIYVYASDSSGREVLVWAFTIPALAGMVAGGILGNNTLIIASAAIILLPLLAVIYTATTRHK